MSIVEGCLRQLRKVPVFFHACRASVGVAWEEGALCFRMPKGEDRVSWQPAQQLAEDPTPFFSELAEQVARYLERRGSGKEDLYLLIPETLAHGYEVRLPAMPTEELREACYWELAHCLAEEGEAMEDYETGSLWRADDASADQAEALQPAAAEGGGVPEDRLCWLAALPRSLTEACRRAFLQADLPAPYLVLKKPEGASYLDGLFIGRRPVKERWNGRRIGAAVTLLTLLVLTFLTGFDLYRTVALSTRASMEEQKLASYRQESREMEIRERIRTQIQVKQQKIAKLSEGALPWYSVLVHFGAILPDGVALDSLCLGQRQGLIVEGQAASYDALAAFLQGLERDDAFFRKKPVLERSALAGQEGGLTVRFRLSMGGEETRDAED